VTDRPEARYKPLASVLGRHLLSALSARPTALYINPITALTFDRKRYRTSASKDLLLGGRSKRLLLLAQHFIMSSIKRLHDSWIPPPTLRRRICLGRQGQRTALTPSKVRWRWSTPPWDPGRFDASGPLLLVNRYSARSELRFEFAAACGRSYNGVLDRVVSAALSMFLKASASKPLDCKQCIDFHNSPFLHMINSSVIRP